MGQPCGITSISQLKGFTTAGKIYGRPEEAYLLAAVVYFVLRYSHLLHGQGAGTHAG